MGRAARCHARRTSKGGRPDALITARPGCRARRTRIASTMPTRREFVRDAALLSGATLVAAQDAGAQSLRPPAALDLPPLDAPPLGAAALADDEPFWARVAERYRVTDRYTNLEAGYFGMMAQPVLEAYHRHIDRVNRESSIFARRDFPVIAQGARIRVAAFIGAKPTEVALTRGATEALQALIGQYNRLKPGDAVMYADLDYNAMQWAMNALAARTGATVAKLVIPEPATRESVIAAYAQAIDANPRTRLLLLTSCNNKTGLMLPMREITAMARARGIDIVVDAAHSFGQVPLTVTELGADFVGVNLHKWIGAPVGAGAMYIREDKLEAIDRAHADESAPLTSIDSRIHTGTSPFSTTMTIPDALDFQETIGVERKSARLRYLRDQWVAAARRIPAVTILTPDEPGMVGALTSFRLHGRTDTASNIALSKTLADEFGVFTFQRTGLAKGDCVRVTVALYNTPKDGEKLVAALATLAKRG